MPDSEIVIASAKRTPVGSFNGALGTTPAHELGAIAIKSALEAAKVDAGEVDEVILGPDPFGRARARIPRARRR